MLDRLFPRSEEALVRQALRGDSEAFERLIERHQRRAHAIARSEDLPARIVELSASRQGLRSVRLAVDLDQDDLRIVLDEGGSLEGLVRGPDGAAFDAPFAVTVRRAAMPSETSAQWLHSAYENSVHFAGTGGRFVVRNLRSEASYTIRVVARGYLEAASDEVRVVPWSAGREPVVLRLERGEALAGIVVDAASGRPLDGVHIAIVQIERRHFDPESIHGWQNRASWAATTDSEGRFAVAGCRRKLGKLLLQKEGFARTVYREVVPGLAQPIGAGAEAWRSEPSFGADRLPAR